jgi:hypothetical protein
MINSPHKPSFAFEQGKNAAEYTPGFSVTQPRKERWESLNPLFMQKIGQFSVVKVLYTQLRE